VGRYEKLKIQLHCGPKKKEKSYIYVDSVTYARMTRKPSELKRNPLLILLLSIF